VSDLPPEEPYAGEDEPMEEGLLDKLRGSGVGTEDPNIVGDVGPTDVPPGKDPDGGLFADPPVEEES
jgi:hypothetical protein